ncbi:hypothetical protein DL89DRAFT_50465 [Linderina pennispora]|uniref:Uncharacterized protein n=1 Tax=Linderina pennispora TaxID=61395 RepID=A0A1Y1VSD1_9FUNG|nr:uncharacterized protein DL89DRAFT_50465 [Linderina pennispora]ORX64083.1 hypothetical protein DL89DRAFT_50465 [Linderina pennispora]
MTEGNSIPRPCRSSLHRSPLSINWIGKPLPKCSVTTATPPARRSSEQGAFRWAGARVGHSQPTGKRYKSPSSQPWKGIIFHLFTQTAPFLQALYCQLLTCTRFRQAPAHRWFRATRRSRCARTARRSCALILRCSASLCSIRRSGAPAPPRCPDTRSRSHAVYASHS